MKEPNGERQGTYKQNHRGIQLSNACLYAQAQQWILLKSQRARASIGKRERTHFQE